MLDIPGYRVLGTLQATGSNVLFHAVREADGTPLIIKTPRAPSPSTREREKYRREFAILRRLWDVPGVTRLRSCEWLHGRPVLLLEPVRGEPLSESVGGPMAVSRFLRMALSLASTLGEVHRRDVIHKDIKPSNIVLEPSGEVRLIDFGMATLQQVEYLEAAPTHLIEGTLAYMSPEQTGRMNRAVDYRTDFYSLGVTCYELLTGRKPFQARDALEWFHAHLALQPKPPHELNPQVPPALSAIVMKLLAKVAEERYQSAEGLKADLERCREALGQGSREAFSLGTRDTPQRFQLPQRLYGREAQVATLLEGYERVARTGRPELLLIRGYSGIGKSSVVHELYKPVVRRRGFFLSGKFDQLQRDVPYATLAQSLHGLVQQLLAGSDEELARWRERVNQAWEGQGQLLVDLVPRLEVVVGPQPALQELPASEAERRFFRVMRQFVSVFSTREHPAVVFLDDLQWADSSSLWLLAQMMTQPESPPVLWLGAYRDNEVDASHPLPPMLRSVREAGVRLTDVHLEPLSVTQVEQLVGDALPGAGADVVVPLAALVHEKTGGNPFFLLRLLATLHQDGLLVHPPEGGWRWDAEGVRLRDYSENVVDFMVGKLRQLPPDTQHLLRLAACAGNVFSLQMLGTLSGLPEVTPVEQGLEPALREGLLGRAGAETYRFLHDRIQQAAHLLSSETERQQVHLRIGRLLLQSLSPEELRESLFEVVSQLNAGVALMEGPAERHQLARLNAEAGGRAQTALALGPALTYFTTAFSLIPGDPWETDAPLAFQLRLAQARMEARLGDVSGAHRLLEELRPRARIRADTVALYLLTQDLHFARGEFLQGMSSNLECLELLGMPIPRDPTWEEAVAAHEEVWTLLGQRPIESLLSLPLMSDPDMKLAINALFRLFGAAYATNPHLLIILLSRMVSLSLCHGFVDTAAHGYSWFGVVTGSFFKRYREGFAFARLALGFVERHNLSADRGGVLHTMQFSSYWVQPLFRAQELALNSLHHALQTGDSVSAAYGSVYLITHRLAMGHPLDEIHQESLVRGEYLRKTGNLDAQDWFLPAQRYIQQMRGHSLSFDTLNGEGFDERAFEARMTPERMSSTRCHYWALKLQSRFMCGAHAEAREAADEVAGLLWSICGALMLREVHVFRALTLAACFARATPEEQREFLEAIARHHQQLAEWAENCPENFRALERLVFAERARIEGRAEEATRAYEEAIRSARENGATQYLGLASELAANFWLAREAPIVAQGFAREARMAYRQWGARAKVRQLDARWAHLAPSEPLPDEQTTSGTDSTRIDALTVVKAQQAVSGEIVLERLVTALMRAALENAGAQRGALLLPEGDALAVAALFQLSPEGTLAASDEQGHHALPWTLLGYVRRTCEHVLIGDASQPHPFSSDEYLARGTARSVLCLPLLRQERFSGVLYVENDLATNAFSPARLALLGHLASQAAISIENARLYADVQRARTELRQANDELERRVEERTHELKKTQARLVDTARAVGMAEVAANVLHTVGNVLTSAVVNIKMMHTAAGALRVGRVRQAAALLVEHRENLADFLTKDPRGGHLPDYLVALGDDLQHEQTRLMEDMQEMNRHIEHIRAIVEMKPYADVRNSLMEEECDLSIIIDDALRIQMAVLGRHGITIHRELAEVPRVSVDKHKVMQILLNLISNAAHALDGVPEGQRDLWVRLSAEENVARIQVEDDGVGIAPELMGKLFTHGFTTRKDGHGFGLHSSALAAQMMKGRLTLRSAGPGQGAVATLELPLTSEGSPRASS